jgi:outer membrane protein assembly factor BamB
VSWSAPVGGAGLQPAVAGGVVVVATDAGTIAAFAADGCGAGDCPTLWSADLGSPATGAPAISRGRIHVGTAAGDLVTYAPAP